MAALLSSPPPSERPRDKKGKHRAGVTMTRTSRRHVDGQAGEHSTRVFGQKSPGPRSGAVRQDLGRA